MISTSLLFFTLFSCGAIPQSCMKVQEGFIAQDPVMQYYVQNTEMYLNAHIVPTNDLYKNMMYGANILQSKSITLTWRF